ncbi:transcriptional regulator (plasmid) [Rhodococcus erythropolis R138]|uniref:IclR family transcriptional regulator n=1 Tax=Rhodococcus erythropolis TaxID=1833 RepID=UPI0004A87479|nr:IclR family transcriptional regulator [Rhodococcus erythropolis]ALU73531.1 transcriptional regulator [Rhodococcus erythropolis R138]
MSTSPTEGPPVSAVGRVSLVLETFNSAGPLTLAQVTQKTGIPRSSAHRLLEQLASVGWLARSPEQTYELGVKAYEMGQAALNQNRLLQHARPVLHAFAQRTGYTIQLAVVDVADTVYLAKVNGRASGSTPTAVGQRVPAHLTAVGKVIMANATVAKSYSLGGRHKNSPTSPRKNFAHATSSQFAREFAQVREKGAAFDRGDAFPGIGCVGVSIGPPDHVYGNMAGLSICASIGSLDHQKMIGPLRSTARDIWDRCVAADLASH